MWWLCLECVTCVHVYLVLQAGSGLSAFLPAPRGLQGPKKIGLQVTTSTTVSKTAPSSLLPYSLTKKKNTSDKERKKQPSKQAKNANSDNEESGDEESISFFSHLQSPPSKEAPSTDFSAQNAMSTSQHFASSSIGSTSLSPLTQCHPLSYSTPSQPTILQQSPAIVTPSSSTGEAKYGHVSHSLAYSGQGCYPGIPDQDDSSIAASCVVGAESGRTPPSTEWSAQGTAAPNQDDVLEMNEAAVWSQFHCAKCMAMFNSLLYSFLVEETYSAQFCVSKEIKKVLLLSWFSMR